MTTLMTCWKSSKRTNKLKAGGSGDQHQSLTPSKNIAIIPAVLDAEVKEIKIAHRIVCLQAVVALVVASIAYASNSAPGIALAVLGGGFVSVANGALLAWRFSRSVYCSRHETHHSLDVHHQLRLLYFYAAERFLVVVALLGLCMAALKLAPLAVLVGFVIGQSVQMVARIFLKNL